MELIPISVKSQIPNLNFQVKSVITISLPNDDGQKGKLNLDCFGIWN